MINISAPKPSFWRMRRVKNGPMVGAAIFYRPSQDQDEGGDLDRPFLWETWIDREMVRDPSPDPVHAGVYRVWGIAKDRITKEEFDFWNASNEWHEQFAPNSPEASTKQSVDLTKIAPITPE